MFDTNVILISGCTLMAIWNVVQFIRRGRISTLWLAASWLMLLGFWLFHCQPFAFGAGMCLIFGLAAQFLPMIKKEPESIVEDPLQRKRIGMLCSSIGVTYLLIISTIYVAVPQSRAFQGLKTPNTPRPVAFEENAPAVSSKPTPVRVGAQVFADWGGKPYVPSSDLYDGVVTFSLQPASGGLNRPGLSGTLELKRDGKEVAISLNLNDARLSRLLHYGLGKPEDSGVTLLSYAPPVWRKAMETPLFSGIQAVEHRRDIYDIKVEKKQYTLELQNQQPYYAAALLPGAKESASIAVIRVSNLVDLEGNPLPEPIIFTMSASDGLFVGQ